MMLFLDVVRVLNVSITYVTSRHSVMLAQARQIYYVCGFVLAHVHPSSTFSVSKYL